MPAAIFDQFSTARPLIQGYPQWVSDPDRTRIAAYQLYEEMYWNVPESFKLIQRGADSKPIYVPAAKTIVETLHRYLAPGMQIVVDPALGTSSDQKLATETMAAFLRRERFLSKFAMNKRYGIIRGDWVFHVTADPEREEGSRISIEAVDPGAYFPIYQSDESDIIIGAHLVEQMESDGKPAILRQTYRKVTERGGPSSIEVSESLFEVDAWGGPDMDEKTIAVIRPPEILPDEITAIPVYHIPNFIAPEETFGSSELRGMERLLSAINQAISDEELELAMMGLGVYTTDAGRPVTDTGEPASWNLGPAKVVELPTGKTFNRVNATQTVAPYQDHIRYLHEQLDLGVGQTAVAKGKVDVQVAESGIALLLEFGPIFARCEEKELPITDVLGNMLYDLRAWFDAFEGINVGEAVWMPAYGDRLPLNRKQRFDELMKMYENNIISAEYLRDELTKLGYRFPPATSLMNQILEEKMALAQVDADVTGARVDAELGDEDADARP